MLKRTSSRIYPRGFVGPESSTALVIDVAERSMIETQVAGATASITISDKSNIQPDMGVVSLFKQIEREPTLIDDFATCEVLYTIALKMFGPTVQEWIKSQQESKFFDINHLEFIQDLVRFSLGDGNMSVSVFQWQHLLSGNNSERVPMKLTKELLNVRATPVDFVNGFLTKKMGKSILLRALWILYGEDEVAIKSGYTIKA